MERYRILLPIDHVDDSSMRRKVIWNSVSCRPILADDEIVAESNEQLELARSLSFLFRDLGSSSCLSILRKFEQAQAQARPFKKVWSRLELELKLAKYFEQT